MNDYRPILAWAPAPTRTEKLRFKASLDKAGVERHRKKLEKTKFVHSMQLVDEGDVYNISYEVLLEYFGQVEAHLDAFSDLIDDPAIVVDANIDELYHGRSVLVDLVRKIEGIKARLENAKWGASLGEGTAAAIAPKPEPEPGMWARILARWGP